jgi:hypothetical protein
MRGRRLTANSQTESHPIRSWRGLPPMAAIAVALGEPYLSQWPEMKRHAAGGTLAVLTHSDWRELGNVSVLCESPPAALCQPEGLTSVPDFWPFPPKPEPVVRC